MYHCDGKEMILSYQTGVGSRLVLAGDCYVYDAFQLVEQDRIPDSTAADETWTGPDTPKQVACDQPIFPSCPTARGLECSWSIDENGHGLPTCPFRTPARHHGPTGGPSALTLVLRNWGTMNGPYQAALATVNRLVSTCFDLFYCVQGHRVSFSYSEDPTPGVDTAVSRVPRLGEATSHNGSINRLRLAGWWPVSACTNGTFHLRSGLTRSLDQPPRRLTSRCPLMSCPIPI